MGDSRAAACVGLRPNPQGLTHAFAPGRFQLMQEGALVTVPIGYWRNFLLPQGVAKIADETVLE